MSNEIHPTAPRDPAINPAADVPPQGIHLGAEPQKANRLIRRWLMRAASALERAERRIIENFRVPPGGG